MITGKVSSAPKKAYLRCDGKGFNSSLGSLSSEGNALSSFGDLPNDSVIRPPLQCIMALEVAKNHWELRSLIHHRLSVEHNKIHREVELVYLYQYILHYPSRNFYTTVS